MLCVMCCCRAPCATEGSCAAAMHATKSICDTCSCHQTASSTPCSSAKVPCCCPPQPASQQQEQQQQQQHLQQQQCYQHQQQACSQLAPLAGKVRPRFASNRPSDKQQLQHLWQHWQQTLQQQQQQQQQWHQQSPAGEQHPLCCCS
jgi:hypothetical protein